MAKKSKKSPEDVRHPVSAQELLSLGLINEDQVEEISEYLALKRELKSLVGEVSEGPGSWGPGLHELLGSLSQSLHGHTGAIEKKLQRAQLLLKKMEKQERFAGERLRAALRATAVLGAQARSYRQWLNDCHDRLARPLATDEQVFEEFVKALTALGSTSFWGAARK
jgi:ABC-type transporter Mla subunit MlaD